MVHMQRGDHIIKLITLMTACLHWFNPIIGLSLVLAHKDMKKSYDEKAIRFAKGDIRKEYCTALLSFGHGLFSI